LVVVAVSVERFVIVLLALLTIIPPWKVRRLVAVSVASERKKDVDATPPTLRESKDVGTEPMILRGLISPSHDGEPVPPTSTPRYSVWLKLTPVSAEVLPSITEKRPSVTWTLFVEVSDSVQTAEVVAIDGVVSNQKRMLYVPFATATPVGVVSFPW
jgi:hypothetical protein